MVIRRTYRYRLHPNRGQCEALNQTLGMCRWPYNSALQERRDAYRGNGVALSRFDQQNELPECKLQNPELNVVYAQTLQDVLRRLDLAFKSFFRRVKSGGKPGYPRFKPSDRYNSFAYPQGGFRVDGNKLMLSKVGAVRINMSRPITGNVKTLAITRNGRGMWYACFSTVTEREVVPREVNRAVGIDLGLTAFLATSDGETISNPKWFRRGEHKLGQAQRLLSRKARGSSNQKKQKVVVAKVYEKIRNQRLDFHHKLSKRFVGTYDLIAYEDLNIKGMVQNHKLAKSISDAAWGMFLQKLLYKAEEAGVTMVGVNPRGTSQVCSGCGAAVPKLLSERVHRCSCGLEIDRDVNAARNILKIGWVRPESTLVEMPVEASLKQEHALCQRHNSQKNNMVVRVASSLP